ncbi:hypothetical protein E2C01_040852 [Portunus trituberculatus]|uniref:Uncharacterized protein n=1 Tax=Portunus trituberculatus TaxID=210409 RepID=A0A5B7FP39_PORTR|nr:hypothetical protein [Portunus trituberculatus]
MNNKDHEAFTCITNYTTAGKQIGKQAGRQMSESQSSTGDKEEDGGWGERKNSSNLPPGRIRNMYLWLLSVNVSRKASEQRLMREMLHLRREIPNMVSFCGNVPMIRSFTASVPTVCLPELYLILERLPAEVIFA